MKTYSKNIKLAAQILILLAGLFWIQLSSMDEQTSPEIQVPQAGYFAPDLELFTLDSEPISLTELRGRPIILNFWASWCPPCRAEMPDFQRASQEYNDSGLVIIGVNATNQDALPEVKQFLLQHGITFPIVLDVQGIATRDYQVHSLPTTYFIDSTGKISKVVIGGPLPLSLLRIEAENLLKEDS